MNSSTELDFLLSFLSDSEVINQQQQQLTNCSQQFSNNQVVIDQVSIRVFSPELNLFPSTLCIKNDHDIGKEKNCFQTTMASGTSIYLPPTPPSSDGECYHSDNQSIHDVQIPLSKFMTSNDMNIGKSDLYNSQEQFQDQQVPIAPQSTNQEITIPNPVPQLYSSYREVTNEQERSKFQPRLGPSNKFVPSRQGLINVGRRTNPDLERRRTHYCTFLNCTKAYTKSSHLKAHQR